MLAVMVIASCSKQKKAESAGIYEYHETEGFNRADSIIDKLSDLRDYNWMLRATDSLYERGELSKPKYIFYSDANALKAIKTDSVMSKLPAIKAGNVLQITDSEMKRQGGTAVQTVKRMVDFVYKGKARSAQPYRLIHKSGAWYLAALEDGATQLKVFSLARIQALQVDKNARFRHQQRHLDYLASQSDVWFTPSATTVRLRAAPEIAHYFQRRELLPQQDIFQNPDGSLQITARIHHLQQLLPVVRYWMPHLRIVQPGEWEQRLLDELRQTLAAWGGAEQEKQAATKPAKKPAKKPARPKRAKQ